MNIPNNPNATITCHSLVEKAPANMADAPTNPLVAKTAVDPNFSTKRPANGPP